MAGRAHIWLGLLVCVLTASCAETKDPTTEIRAFFDQHVAEFGELGGLVAAEKRPISVEVCWHDQGTCELFQSLSTDTYEAENQSRIEELLLAIFSESDVKSVVLVQNPITMDAYLQRPIYSRNTATELIGSEKNQLLIATLMFSTENIFTDEKCFVRLTEQADNSR